MIEDASGFRRTDAGKQRPNGPLTLREWFRLATPMERILRGWWWVFCVAMGLAFGLSIVTLVTVAYVLGAT